ncbi:hypothetical protein C1645_770692 [Glomus cerebriforme]|uniref:F-box domain-containing protein n=1 Tax=Glomus cerebriforme TaxID=658196 RepID=A0A397SYQ2_9GLOM|nr:hypothetical protein C1645_770692 [Glomus cerebriforme]
MALQLSTESWIHIFNYLETSSDLYSCLLVNRCWCKIIVQILWKRPFSHIPTDKKYHLILKTYLKCLSKQSIEKLKEGGIKSVIFNEKPMFYYIEFLKELIIDSDRFDSSLILLIKEIKNEEKNKKKKFQNIFKELDIIFEELTKLICYNSNKIQSLSIVPCKMIDYIIPLLLKEDNNNFFKRIKTFTFETSPDLNGLDKVHKPHEMIVALSRASRDITHIRINNINETFKFGGDLNFLLTLLESASNSLVLSKF